MNDDLIRGIINEEIYDMNLYLMEADLFSKKIIKGKLISKTFRDFAKDEATHANILLKICRKKVKYQERKILPIKSIRKVLQIHLIRESDSIKLYEVLLNDIYNSSYKTIIKEIIENEKKHLKIIKKYLLSIG